jgi:adenosine tuberculosinyltransferase
MGEDMISLDEFLALPTEEAARLVRAAGPQVCVFPINGTRRWFLLEHADRVSGNPVEAYLDISSENHIGLYRMFFEHGIETLLTPTLGPDILLRGEAYMQQIGATGLARLANGADFLRFYDEQDVRVRFYGDYRKLLANTAHAYLSELFDDVTSKTQKHQRNRLFFGVFANDATESVAEMSIRYYKECGKIPDKQNLVEWYYGEYIEPASLFIGFDKLSVFDYPLLSSGEEDLYFTVAPSPYMKEKQLRAILYDHLYTRRTEETDYSTLTVETQNQIRDFYHANVDSTLGIGEHYAGSWIPTINVASPKRK